MFVDVSVIGYAGKDIRTFCYLSELGDLGIGQIVSLRFAKKPSLGVIRRTNAPKPAGVKRFEKISSVLPLAPIPESLLSLADWMIDYYACSSSSVWQLLLPKNPTTKPRKIFKSKQVKLTPLVQLSTAQKKALSAIEKSSKPVMLEGVMGSGKTEIYFHLIKKALEGNKSALLLMPEIFLTNQMILRAKKHFGERLLVTHSGMTSAERRAFWDKCSEQSRSGVVVLGARSALFAPIHNLGLIVIDECHEQSYKQDASPRYLSEHVAAKLSNLSGAKLVLGSATPSVATRYLADAGKLGLVMLSERASESAHPNITIVDTTKQADSISKDLDEAIKKSITSKQSVLLYINRRGTTPLFICGDCGHSFVCPICHLNLHLHADIMRLNCHGCGYSTTPTAECPSCGSMNLRGVGVGTKAVESKINADYPKSKAVRIDRDSANPKDFSEILKKLQKGQVDFIIGTQMLGRGLDIANLSLVGIINADYDLLSNDFNSRERAFQQISQTAGRAGRRKQRGEVIIQTKLPGDEVLGFVTDNDYKAFYRDELEKRKKYSYPPYAYLLKLECGLKNQNLALSKCEVLLKQLESRPDLEILGPSKSYPFIRQGKHYWKLIIKAKSRKKLVEIAKSLDSNWIINLDPFGIT